MWDRSSACWPSTADCVACQGMQRALYRFRTGSAGHTRGECQLPPPFAAPIAGTQDRGQMHEEGVGTLVAMLSSPGQYVQTVQE